MRAVALLAALSAVVAGACGGGTAGTDDGRTSVVGSFFPLAEVARQVGGDAVRVTDLTPAGAEPHDLELTTRQADAIQDAAVVVVMGRDFQPAAEDIAGRRDGVTVEVLDALAVDEGNDDPHVWLDPVEMQRIVSEIEDALADADPENAATYRANAARYTARLQTLDDEYEVGLANCDRDEIVTAHESFGWLARRYGLTQHAVAGISPDEEPSADRIAELADLAEDEGVTTIFTEELVSPRIARTLAREAGGLQTATLDPLEGDPDEGDYVSTMMDNLRTLRAALDCA